MIILHVGNGNLGDFLHNTGLMLFPSDSSEGGHSSEHSRHEISWSLSSQGVHLSLVSVKILGE